MRAFRLAVWPSLPDVDLTNVERGVIRALCPPLNLTEVRTHWKPLIDGGRRRLGAEARAWDPGD